MKVSGGTKYCSYINFYSLYNIWKDQLYRMSGSDFSEWFFGPEKFSGLSRNRPLVTIAIMLNAHFQALGNTKQRNKSVWRLNNYSNELLGHL